MFFGVFLSSLDLSSHVIVAQQLGATIVCIRDQRIMLMPVSMPTKHDHGKEDAKMQKRKRGCLQTHNWQLRLMIKM